MFGKLNLPPLKKRKQACKNDGLEKAHGIIHDAAFDLTNGNYEECAKRIKQVDDLLHTLIGDKSQLIDLSSMEKEFFKEHQVLTKYPLTTRSVFKWLRDNINKY